MPQRRRLATHELYAEQLLPLNLGFALYEPDPGPGKDEVRIGDVGFVYDGRFKRLASVFESGNGISFALEEQFCGTEPFTDLDDGVLSSRSVRSEGFEGDLSGVDPTTGSSACVSWKFSCESERGATLIRKYRATVEKASFPIKLKQHFAKYFRSVYDFARSSGFVENLQDIIMVTGRVMTGDWATLAFYNHSQDSSASFDIKAATVTANGRLWGKWSENIDFPKRHGPLRQQAVVDGHEPHFNQCVFIETCRYYDLPWYNRLIATVSVSQRKGSSAKSSGTGYGSNKGGQTGVSTSPSPTIGRTNMSGSSAEMSLSDTNPQEEMLTAYDVLAVQAFRSSGSSFNYICIDENDVKRLLPASGPLTSVLGGSLDFQELCIVKSDFGEPNPHGHEIIELEVGKIDHDPDPLIQDEESFDSFHGASDIEVDEQLLESSSPPQEISAEPAQASGSNLIAGLTNPTHNTPSSISTARKGKAPIRMKSLSRAKSGCYTCRIRRKKCDEKQDAEGNCQTCVRLRLQCLGFGAKRPDWMREGNSVPELRERIKNFLAEQGLIKGHSSTATRMLVQTSQPQHTQVEQRWDKPNQRYGSNVEQTFSPDADRPPSPKPVQHGSNSLLSSTRPFGLQAGGTLPSHMDMRSPFPTDNQLDDFMDDH